MCRIISERKHSILTLVKAVMLQMQQKKAQGADSVPVFLISRGAPARC